MRFDVHVQGHGEGPRSSFMTGAVPPRIRLHTGCRHSFELHMYCTVPEARFAKSKKLHRFPIHGYVSLSPWLRLVFRKAERHGPMSVER
jgi:hypothetical protein